MKNCLLPLALLASSLSLPAEKILYEGTWTNTTFGTAGPLSFELEDSQSLIKVTIDLDGPVFGEGDPPAFSFDVPLDEAGNGDFRATGTQIGDVSGSVDGDGEVKVTITNVPVGFLSKVGMEGRIDLENRQFTGTYEIFSELGRFAEGELEASGDDPVSQPTTINAPRKVSTSSRRKTIRARITGDTPTGALTAEVVKGKARVVVKGNNPYRIRVKRIRSRRVIVMLAAARETESPIEHRIRIRREVRTEETRSYDPTQRISAQ